MFLKDYLDVNLLESHIQNGLVTKRFRKDGKFYILNYTNECQFENIWDDITCKCRGLVCDASNDWVVCRPYQKFFNYEQVLDKIPNLPFSLFEKLDGSLIVAAEYKGELVWATRGSFHSDQAEWAEKLLRVYWEDFSCSDYPTENLTFLFEAVYSENQIVVKYEKDNLILHGVLDNDTGKDYFLFDSEWFDGFFYIAKKCDYRNLEEIKKLDWPNAEGFVATFENGFKCKIKFENYVRLHKVLTGVSEKHVWEHLAANTPLSEYLKDIPDEFMDWMKEVETKLKNEFKIIETCGKMLHDWAKSESVDQKGFAVKVLSQSNKLLTSVAFSLYHNRDYSETIWKTLKPIGNDVVFKREKE
jgi:RNA ligase